MPLNSDPSKESIGRIEQLVRKAESLPDPSARSLAADLVQAVMEYHATALERILQVVAAHDQEGSTIDELTSDELVSSVLVLHGLHPSDLNTRIHSAVEKLRQFFDPRGTIELLEVSAELVRVRFTGKRPGSGEAAKQVIEDALFEAAPEIQQLVVEGTEGQSDSNFVSLKDLVATLEI